MEKLIKKFESIINLYPGSNVPAPNYPKTTIGERGAIECKKVAIAFATHLLQSKICKCTKGSLGETIKEEYWPPEYQLLLGEIIKNENLFNKFIKEEYGRE
jgi:hypothetical protein